VAQREPRWAEIFSARCTAQLGLKRPDSAAADCRYALQVKPELVVALYGLATAERALGQNALAAAHFRQYASSSNPDATPALKADARRAAEALEPQAAAPAPPAPPAAVEQKVAQGDAPQEEAVRRPARPRGGHYACTTDLDCSAGLSCKGDGNGIKTCTR
jgi:hypothetical protein